MSDFKKKRRKREELLLRFFAFSARYEEFDKSVVDFLDVFYKDMSDLAEYSGLEREFSAMLAFVDQHFPCGFAKNKNTNSTPRLRFEAISVGAALALRANPNLKPNPVSSWLESDNFKRQTASDSIDSRPRVKSRLEYVRDRLLAKLVC